MNLNFSKINVLVIGDIMLDKYIYGSSNRISPEAPVPVITPNEHISYPGGAANVAMNLKNLGANVSLAGYVGKDSEGFELIKQLKSKKINCSSIDFLDINTTVKKRYFCNGKQILRVDKEKILDNWKPKSISKLESFDFDVIIFSDYNKGVLNNRWFQKLNSKNIIVDPKKNDFEFYKNASIITPNIEELQKACKKELINSGQIIEACEMLIKKIDLEFIVAKRGDKGMILVGRDNYSKKINAHKIKTPDVTGAGDTVISALSLAFTKFNDIEKAAEIANAAAAIVVDKSGTATVTTNEIIDLLF